jgi:uncharacterized membrane protein (UPF0127 family)
VTASEPKELKPESRWLHLLRSKRAQAGLLVACLTLIIGLIVVVSRNAKDIIMLGDQKIRIETVSTEAARMQGLSGRQRMAANEGMLFVFDNSDIHCFWMKDMYFNIDMIWFDENERVVTIKHNASPDSYPESFCPDKPAKYVLEVTAGVSKKAHLTPGTQINF